MNHVVLDTKTGEMIPLNISKKDVKAFVTNLTDEQKASLLIKMLDIRKVSEAFEKEIKDYVKTQDIKEGMWQNFKVSDAYRYSFDKTRFEKDATPEEMEVYEKMKTIEQKYMKAIIYKLIK